MGQPSASDCTTMQSMGQTRGTETSHYPEEKKEKSILKVVASEIGRAQTSYSNMWRVRTLFSTELDSRTHLEKWTEEGNSPVHEIE